jgi:hypothetical protein
VDLSAEEMQALASLLPKGYSFHIDHRKKEQKPQTKKKNPDELLLASALEFNFKPKPVASSSQVHQQVASKKPLSRPDSMS